MCANSVKTFSTKSEPADNSTLNDFVNTTRIVWIDSILLNVLFLLIFYCILRKVNKEILNILDVIEFYEIIREILNEGTKF